MQANKWLFFFPFSNRSLDIGNHAVPESSEDTCWRVQIMGHFLLPFTPQTDMDQVKKRHKTVIKHVNLAHAVFACVVLLADSTVRATKQFKVCTWQTIVCWLFRPLRFISQFQMRKSPKSNKSGGKKQKNIGWISEKIYDFWPFIKKHSWINDFLSTEIYWVFSECFFHLLKMTGFFFSQICNNPMGSLDRKNVAMHWLNLMRTLILNIENNIALASHINTNYNIMWAWTFLTRSIFSKL